MKTIFFDAAGTLIHLPRGVGFHYAEVAARHGWEADAKVLAGAFGKAWKAAPAIPTTRQPRPDDDRGWWQALVGRTLDEVAAPQDFDRAAFFAELYQEFARPGVWELYPDVVPVLDAVVRRFALGILSNFDGRLRPALQHLGVLDRFQHFIVSSEAGADKPDPWIFQHALNQTGGRAGETLLVGDDLDCDIHAAERAGWRAFHVDRPRQTLHDLLALLI